ncbi:MAG: arsenite efflux transporter metallochaperone ArsD [Actinomycetota bacterium]
MKIDVYDPAMCCSTGVCGPSVDPALATFAGDLDWLGEHGVDVRRYNLGQEPGAFATNNDVRHLLEADGEGALPAVFVDGEIRSSGRFPSRAEFAGWAGLEPATAADTMVSEAVVTELAAIGAAIGANCEPCFKHHVAEARKLGLTNDNLRSAVRAAQAVKDVPANKITETASRVLGTDPVTLGRAAPSEENEGGGCCGSEAPAAATDEDATTTCG